MINKLTKAERQGDKHMKKIFEHNDSQYYIKGNTIYDRYPTFRSASGSEGVQKVGQLIFRTESGRRPAPIKIDMTLDWTDGWNNPISRQENKIEYNRVCNYLSECTVDNIKWYSMYKQLGNSIRANDLIAIGELVNAYEKKLRNIVKEQVEND